MTLERDLCPVCGQVPNAWIEKPAHGSKRIYWIACRPDNILVGGITRTVAIQNWNREVAIRNVGERGHV